MLVEKVNRPQFLGQMFNRLEVRARPMSTAIEAWLRRFARSELERRGHVQKATKTELREQLKALLLRFSEPHARAAIEEALSLSDREFPSERVSIEELERRVDMVVAEIMGTTEAAVQDAVTDAIISGRDLGLGERDTLRLIRTRVIESSGFSFERAQGIARTELGAAENIGLVQGYNATGAIGLTWFAFQSPTFDRRHHEMDGKTVKTGELFTLPSGVRLRFPLDPQAPIGETINCRCTVGPIFAGTSKSRPKRALNPWRTRHDDE